MTVNTKGPYEVRVPYVASDGFPHTLRLNCIVAGATPAAGTPPEDINLVTRGGTLNLDSAVEGLMTAVQGRIPSSTHFGGYSLWKIPTGGGDPLFITAGDTISTGGVSGDMVESQEEIRTYRSANGGIAKICLMDTVVPGKSRIPLSSSDDITAFVLGTNGWIIARDDGFLVAPINVSMGENEVLFKARHRR